MVVDSTAITVGNCGLQWTVFHGERSGIKLHVSFTPETNMPLKLIETVGLKHDGPVGEGIAYKRFVLVEDRAYFKIKRIDKFILDGQNFVIRVK
ncbi:transposase [Bacillus sp. FSL K6-3431]|uniref:transposase n=1 Tax=Bacillus sp. FSL K6-3431 TaxID=2921500 RepID=UPI0030F84225